MWLPCYSHPRRICQLLLLLLQMYSFPLMERCLGAIIGLCRILIFYYKLNTSGLFIICIGDNIISSSFEVCQHFSYWRLWLIRRCNSVRHLLYILFWTQYPEKRSTLPKKYNGWALSKTTIFWSIINSKYNVNCLFWSALSVDNYKLI